MKRFISMVLASILALVLPVYAFAATVTVNVSHTSGVVTIYGVTSAGAEKAVTVIVLNPAGGTDYLNETLSGADGTYQFQYTLDEPVDGTYTVKVGGTNIAQPVTTTFSFAPPSPLPEDPDDSDPSGPAPGGSSPGSSSPGGSDPGGQTDLPDMELPVSDSDDWVNPYSDVKDTDWFYGAVRFVTDNGLMQGTGNSQFSPGRVVTRGMLATILYRLEKEPETGGDNPFPDITNQYYAKAAVWANETGIMLGYGRFGGDDSLTREQLVTVLYRFAKVKGADAAARAELSGYTDTNAVSDWALEAMEWAVAESIIQGRTTTTLAPQGHATRAEVAAVFMRYIENILDE